MKMNLLYVIDAMHEIVLKGELFYHYSFIDSMLYLCKGGVR